MRTLISVFLKISCRFLFAFTLLLINNIVSGQHGWSFNVYDFENDMQIDAVVNQDGAQVLSGTLGVFVGDECRGFVDGQTGPLGNTYFPLRCWSNTSSGEMLSFRYYDDVDDQVYLIGEQVEFESQAYLGDAINSYQLSVVENSSPVASCPDYSGVVGHPGELVFNVYEIFEDPDGDVLSYVVDYNAESDLSWLNDSVFSFNAAATGESYLEIIAEDLISSATCSYVFDADDINQPPVADNIVELIRLNEGFGSIDIDLDTLFSDPDGDILAYNAVSSIATVADADVSGNILTITEGEPGNTMISITASDGQDSVAQDIALIVVANGPEIPWSLTPENYQYNGQIESVIMVNGVDLTSGRLGAFVGNECRGICSGTFFEPTGRTIFSLMVYSNQDQGEYLTFKYFHPNDEIVFNLDENIEFVADMKTGNAVDPFVFHLTSDNNLPGIVNELPDIQLQEHFESHTVDLDEYFNDPDQDVLSFAVDNEDNDVVTVSLDGQSLNIHEVDLGTSEITVFVSDGMFSIQGSFQVEVDNVNDPPQIALPVQDLEYYEGFRSVSIDVSDVFADPDFDLLALSCTSSDTNVVRSYMNGFNLVLREKGNGTAVLTLCASDGEFEVCDTISVIVHEINDPPVVDCGLFTDTSFVEGVSVMQILGICNAFTDPEEDILTYSVVSDNPDVLQASMNECSIQFTPQGTGSAEISICASDGELQTCCTFHVEIIPENVLEIYHADTLVEDAGIVPICSEPAEIMFDIQSDVDWQAVAFAGWIIPEKLNDRVLRITIPENETGEWRMGLVDVKDNQGHEALFYIWQAEDCVPDGIGMNDVSGIMIYPNPAREMVFIQGDRSMVENWSSYELLSVDGKSITRGALVLEDGVRFSLPVSGLPQGIYFLKIANRKGNFSLHRLLITK